MDIKRVSKFISRIMVAASNCTLYSSEHPVVGEFSEEAFHILEDLYEDESMSFTLLGESLIANNTPLTETGMYITNFIRRLRRKGIEKIIIRKGLDIEELRRFITGIASKEKVLSTPHISVGMVEVRLKTEDYDIGTLMSEHISKVREVYQGISKFKSLDMVGLEDAVIGFISTLKREANVLRIISPVKSYSEYTYVHATNVSVLTIFQAESMGIKGETLYDIGLAGLLHDVGKIFVAKEVLEKQASLDQYEWNLMKMHPVHGAVYLSTLPEIPKLALVATFEHHMKFNGGGYPDTKRRGKRQHIVSQIVTIADFFDALRTERPYKKAFEIKTIVEIMEEATGKDINPFIAENFFDALRRVHAL
jgi:HD-GYP domain-containing protein (c-di-GMP phosphodiesterase class II)